MSSYDISSFNMCTVLRRNEKMRAVLCASVPQCHGSLCLSKMSKQLQLIIAPPFMEISIAKKRTPKIADDDRVDVVFWKTSTQNKRLLSFQSKRGSSGDINHLNQSNKSNLRSKGEREVSISIHISSEHTNHITAQLALSLIFTKAARKLTNKTCRQQQRRILSP